MTLWRTKSGDFIPISDLTDRHLSNILALIARTLGRASVADLGRVASARFACEMTMADALLSDDNASDLQDQLETRLFIAEESGDREELLEFACPELPDLLEEARRRGSCIPLEFSNNRRYTARGRP